MCGSESRLFAQQLHRQHVSRYHNDHGDVEGDQGAEHEERSVIDDAHSRTRHDVGGVDDAWNNKIRLNPLRHLSISPFSD